jgi:hypothetical protein
MELLVRPKAIDSDTITHILPEGPTLEEILVATGWDLALRDFTVILVGDRDIPSSAWGDFRPGDGDKVRVMLRPSGGGRGTGKQIIAAVAIVVIAIVAAYAGAALAPAAAGVFGVTSTAGVAAFGTVITAAITITGSLLVGAFIRPPSLANRTIGANPANDQSTENSIYSVSGSSNSVNRYGSVPRIFGRVRVVPNQAAEPIVIASGAAQTLRGILDFGYGPLSLEDIRIGTTPIRDFPTARYIVHPSFKAGDPLYIYSNDEATLAVGAGLSFGVWNRRTLPQEANAAYFEISFPGGLVEFNQQGQAFVKGEQLNIYARRVNSGEDWIALMDFPHWAWFDSSQVMGAGLSGDRQFSSLTIPLAWNSQNIIFVKEAVPAGSYVRWMGQTFQVLAVGNASPPIPIGPAVSLVLSGLPGGIAWGNGGDPDLCHWPLHEQPQATSWLFDTAPTGGNIWAEFGPSRQDVRFFGQTRVPRAVTVAMTFPSYDLWEVLVIRATPESTDPLIANTMVWNTVRAQAWIPPIAPRFPRTIMEFEVTANDQVSGQIQAINALATSILRDPRVGYNRPSRNPAWAYAELLTGWANRNRIPWSKLNESKLITWANWCDAASPQGDRNATCDLALDFRSTVGEIAQTICAAGRAMPAVRDNEYTVLMENEDRVPVQMFTNRNAKEFSFSRIWVDEPHAVKVRFLSEVSWERDETIVYMDGYDENNATRFDTLDLVGTVRPRQAWRMGRYYLAQVRLRKETCEFSADVENLVCQRGDLVRVAHDRLLRSAVTRAQKFVPPYWQHDSFIDLALSERPLFSRTQGVEWPANLGSGTTLPPNWTQGGTGAMGLTVTVVERGVDKNGHEYADFWVRRTTGITAGTYSLTTRGTAVHDLISDMMFDDVLVMEQRISFFDLQQPFPSDATVQLACAPLSLSGVGGLGIVLLMSGVVPQFRQTPDLQNDVYYAQQQVFASTYGQPGLINRYSSSLRIVFPTGGMPVDFKFRISSLSSRIINPKPNLLARINARGDNAVLNSGAAGAVSGALAGGGTAPGPGKLPDGWSLVQHTGWTVTVTELLRAWDYTAISLSFVAAAGVDPCILRFSDMMSVPAGNVGSVGVQARRTALTGSLPTFALRTVLQDAGGAQISEGSTTVALSTGQENVAVRTNVSLAGAAGWAFDLRVTPAAGQSTNVTLRLVLPLARPGTTNPFLLPAEPGPNEWWADIRLADGTVLNTVQVLEAPDADKLVFSNAVAEQIGPEDLIVLGDKDIETTDWLVDAITPGNDLSASLKLIEYAPSIRDVDDSPIPPYVPPNSETGFLEELPPVPFLDLSFGTGFAGEQSLAVGRLSWAPPPYAVNRYIVERLFRGDRVIVSETRDTSFADSIPNALIQPGGELVEYFVTPVSVRGLRGGEAAISGTVMPDSIPPGTPAITANVLGTVTRLLWTVPPDPDLASYQIRWSPDYTTTVWAEMQILSQSISGATNTLATTTRSGVYAIRAVDLSGNWSAPAFVRTMVDVAPVVDSSYEFKAPAWSGTFENCELDSDGNLVLSVNPITGLYYPEGMFTFSGGLSLLQTWGVRVEGSAEIDSFPADPLSVAHDAQVMVSVLQTLPVLADPWFDPLSNATPLAGGPTAVSPWTPVTAEWVDGRIFRGAVWLRSFNGLVTPVVKSATLEVFFDPRTESGSDVEAVGGVLEVEYRYPFVETPGIQITLNDGGADDRVVRVLSNNNRFRIEVRDAANNLVSGRHIDWSATGYGIGLEG